MRTPVPHPTDTLCPSPDRLRGGKNRINSPPSPVRGGDGRNRVNSPLRSLGPRFGSSNARTPGVRHEVFDTLSPLGGGGPGVAVHNRSYEAVYFASRAGRGLLHIFNLVL